jgi:hypothetical protein
VSIPRLTILFALLSSAILVLPGCGSDDPVVAPTMPLPVSEPVTGILTPNSVRIHPFSVQNAGNVTVTLNSLDPDDPGDPTRVGLDLGTYSGVSCQVTVSSTEIIAGRTIAGTATSAATLCIRIYDVNPLGLAAPVTYSLTVTHF